MHVEHKRRNIALLVLGTGVLMFVIMLVFVLPYFMSEKKYGEMQTALNQRDYYKVFKTAEFLLDQDPDSIQAYYFRGQAYLALHKYEQAEKDLEKVVRLNAQYSNMRNVAIQLGAIYHKHGLSVLSTEPDKAYRLFFKALRYLPRDNDLKRDIAIASYYVGQAVENKDKNKAVKFYKESVKYFPDKALYKFALARALFNTGQIEEAIPFLEQAFNQDAAIKTPANLELIKQVLWRLALTKERDFFEGNLEDAAPVTKRLDQLIALEKTSKEAVLEKFAFAINTNNIEEAKRVLQNVGPNEFLSFNEINLLVNEPWNVTPKTLFDGGNETDVELKLDSELAWSADGSKIIVKAMDKSSSQTKIMVYGVNDSSVNVSQTDEKISWEGKIFTPNNDGVLISSENTLFKLKEDLSLQEINKLGTTPLDVTRDGKRALVSKGKSLHTVNLENDTRSSFATQKLKGDIYTALYSPYNKRVAILVGNEEFKDVAVMLSRYRSKFLAEGNVSSLKWSYDGENVFYLNTQNNRSSVYEVAVEGNSEPKFITKPELNVSLYETSPVDEFIIFKATSGKEILFLSDNEGNLEAATPRYGEFGKFIWSPDGSKATYLFSPVKGGPVRLEMIEIQRF